MNELDINKRMGETIQNLRKRQKLTQDQLAKLTGYKSRSSITMIEKGQTSLDAEQLEYFAKAFNLDAFELFQMGAEGWTLEDVRNYRQLKENENKFKSLFDVYNPTKEEIEKVTSYMEFLVSQRK